MTTKRGPLAELGAFVVHLRIPYQVFLLSGGYLLGGLYATSLDLETFAIQFLVVHVLLNGGVTAYNSYWDDDDGPIGGVEHPPKMSRWMHHASIALQLVGLALVVRLGAAYIAMYVTTMVLSVCYSRKGPRFKGHPILSLFAVGVGTGISTFVMGAIAAGYGTPDPKLLVGSTGVALLLTSLYPVSQIFQIEEDRAAGDTSFAVAYGLAGVRRWFFVAYPLGLATVTATLYAARGGVAFVFLAAGLVGGVLDTRQLLKLEGRREEYRAVMRLKYVASLSFVLFLIGCLAWTHRPLPW